MDAVIRDTAAASAGPSGRHMTAFYRTAWRKAPVAFEE
jgi:hypothetical protein